MPLHPLVSLPPFISSRLMNLVEIYINISIKQNGEKNINHLTDEGIKRSGNNCMLKLINESLHQLLKRRRMTFFSSSLSRPMSLASVFTSRNLNCCLAADLLDEAGDGSCDCMSVKLLMLDAAEKTF